jgi:formylglycine-generating enzyme required for sulfatase activity
MTLSLRFPDVHYKNLLQLYDFLQSCGCTNIRWQVEEFKNDVPRTSKPPQKQSKAIHLPLDPSPEEILVQSDGTPNFTWCEVPAGQFIMGGDPEAWNHADNGIPEIQTGLDYSFWIAKYPVTNSQYKPFDKIEGRAPEHPVVGISWYEVYAYTLWVDDLRQRGKLVLPSQLPPSSREYVIRLPRECEWEKAARYPYGQLFPWGNQWDATRLNWGKSGIGGTSTVGRFRDGANPFHGACDLLGNVSEWCLTLWQPMPSPENENNRPQGRGHRCVRSGSWDDRDRDLLRSAARFAYDPGTAYNDLGFRLVLSIRL